MGASICNRNCVMTGLWFLFRVTLRDWILPPRSVTSKSPGRILLEMSPDEAKRFVRPFLVRQIARIMQLVPIEFGVVLACPHRRRLQNQAVNLEITTDWADTYRKLLA